MRVTYSYPHTFVNTVPELGKILIQVSNKNSPELVLHKLSTILELKSGVKNPLQRKRNEEYWQRQQNQGSKRRNNMCCIHLFKFMGRISIEKRQIDLRRSETEHDFIK